MSSASKQYFSSTGSHRALMIVTSFIALAIMASLVIGWMWHLEARAARAQMIELALKYEKRGSDSPARSTPRIESLSEPESGRANGARTQTVKTTASRPARTDAVLLANLLKPETFPKDAAAIVPVDGELPDSLKAEAMDLMQRYLQARSWREKLPLVRDAARLEPMMRNFYEEQKHADPVVDRLEGVQQFLFHGVEMLKLDYAARSVSGKLEAALLRDPAGALKLDWESYVGYSDMAWSACRKARPTEPKVFRAFASVGDYWNYEFQDESRYLSVRLVSPDELETLHGFCERDSGVGRELSSVLSRSAQQQAVTVRIAFPEKAESDECVRILGLVAERWLMPP